MSNSDKLRRAIQLLLEVAEDMEKVTAITTFPTAPIDGMVQCLVCKEEGKDTRRHTLTRHLKAEHFMAVFQYKAKFNGAEVMSDWFKDRQEQKATDRRRQVKHGI